MEATHDFTYIDNVIEMNIRAIGMDNPKARNAVYTIVFGEQTTLSELEEGIAEVPVKYGPERQGNAPHSFASIEKTKKLPGYEAKYNIEKEPKETVGWYWKHLR
ncbi:hypothetical protein [Ulvibacterium sp.]|uniref:hypothetical protein n=1 Tax=Ulvibacterium sp. TaxID=2665914 RepID=UPI003BAAE4AD